MPPILGGDDSGDEEVDSQGYPEAHQRAEELGLLLDDSVLDHLASMPVQEAFDLLDFVSEEGDDIYDPNKYISRFCERVGKGKGKPTRRRKRGEKDGRCGAKASELGLQLSDSALDKLSLVPLQEAYALLESVADQGDKIRNPSGYIVKACGTLLGGGKGEGKGGRTQEASDSGKGKGVRSHEGKGRGGGTGDLNEVDQAMKVLKDQRVQLGSARARELGLTLDHRALDKLASIALPKAYELLQSVADKGSEINNPSGYLVKACERIAGSASGEDASAGKGSNSGGAAVAGKGGNSGGGAPAGKGGNPGGGASAGKGGKTGARAAELGLNLNDSALEKLAKVSLPDAYNLLDQCAEMLAACLGKGAWGKRDPSKWIVSACENFFKSGVRDAAGRVGSGTGSENQGKGKAGSESKGKGKQLKENTIEDRVILLNKAKLWKDSSIDVEAMMSLKGLKNDDAHDLLDKVEVQALSIGNPSGYIISAAWKLGQNQKSKRSRDDSDALENQRKQWKIANGGGQSANNPSWQSLSALGSILKET